MINNHNDNGALALEKNPGSAPDSVVSCKLGPSCPTSSYHFYFHKDMTIKKLCTVQTSQFTE